MKFNIVCKDHLDVLKKDLLMEHEECLATSDITLNFVPSLDEALKEDGYHYAVADSDDMYNEAVRKGFDYVLRYLSNEDGSMGYFLDCFGKCLEGYAFLLYILKKLDEGVYTVRFKESLFGGGHDYDAHVFELHEDKRHIGELELLDLKEIRFSFNPLFATFNEAAPDVVTQSKQTEAYKLTKEALQKAMYRDDTEYIAQHGNEKKEVLVPCCYIDVDRDSALNNLESFAPDAFVAI